MSERIGKLTSRLVKRTGEATPRRLRRLAADLSHKDRGTWLRVSRKWLAENTAPRP